MKKNQKILLQHSFGKLLLNHYVFVVLKSIGKKDGWFIKQNGLQSDISLVCNLQFTLFTRSGFKNYGLKIIW